MNYKRWIILIIFSFILAGLHLNSTTWFRLRLADYCVKKKKYQYAIGLYKKNLRRVRVLAKSNNLLYRKPNNYCNRPKAKILYYLIECCLLANRKTDAYKYWLQLKKANITTDFTEQITEKIRNLDIQEGDLHYFEGEFDRAIISYSKNIGLKDKAPGAYIGLILINAKEEKWDKASEYLNRSYHLLIEDEILNKIVSSPFSIHSFTISELLKPDVLNKFYLFKELSFFELENILKRFDITLLYPNKKTIGKTEINMPTNVIVRSAGACVGNYSSVIIGNKDHSLNKRGYNIVVMDEEGCITDIRNFDTCGSLDEAKKLAEFIREIEDGHMVIASIKDEASLSLRRETISAFKSIGSKYISRLKYRNSHVIVGIKGARAGFAEEKISNLPVEINIGKRKSLNSGDIRNKFIIILTSEDLEDNILIVKKQQVPSTREK